MEEIWKIIPKSNNRYEVSNFGRVRSNFNNKVTILTGAIDKGGYRRYLLVIDGHRKNVFAHRLVAEAFLENPDNKRVIDHINTKRTDNRVSNLRWVTHKENSNNKLSLKHLSCSLRKSQNIKTRKPVRKYDKYGNFVKEYNSVTDAARDNNCTDTEIFKVAYHKKHSCREYVFRFVSEVGKAKTIPISKGYVKPFTKSVLAYTKEGLCKTYAKVKDCALDFSVPSWKIVYCIQVAKPINNTYFKYC